MTVAERFIQELQLALLQFPDLDHLSFSTQSSNMVIVHGLRDEDDTPSDCQEGHFSQALLAVQQGCNIRIEGDVDVNESQERGTRCLVVQQYQAVVA